MTDTQQQRLLSELLNEIVRADMEIAPPRGLEERALERLGGNATAAAARIRRRSPTPVWLIPCVGAVAAAVLLFVVVNVSSRKPVAGPDPADHTEVHAQQAAIGAPPAAAASPVAARRAVAVARAGAAHSQHVERPSEIMSFVPLSPDARQELLGSFQVARVLLPREVLTDLGVVLDANRVGEPIQADVVFGEDGLARAIRLASQDVRRSQ